MALRHLAVSMAGYAFALATRAGLSPEEAARFWLEAVSSTGSDGSVASPEEIEANARRDATTMEMINGNAALSREGEVWCIQVDAGGDRADLERWGASLDFWARWLTEQGRLLAQRDGRRSTTRLEGSTLHIEESPL
jgi:hypothetical protein